MRGINNALTKEHVRACKSEMERARGAELYVESLDVGVKLMRDSDSDHVRLQAAQWVNQRTDPQAHLRGADTAKTLIIQLNSHNAGQGPLIRDQASGTVKLLEKQGAIDVASEPVDSDE